MRRLGSRLPCVVLVALGGALAGCGGSSSSSSPVSAPTDTPSTPASSAPATLPTTPTVAVNAPPCTAAELTLHYLGQQGAAGHGELGFSLTNTSGHPCRTFGYPGVQFLDATGAPLPTTSTRTEHDLFGSAPKRKLVLAPSQSASFRLGVSHGLGTSSGCTTAAILAVIPPDDTEQMRVTIPGGAYECGTTTVSPLQPNGTAYS